MARPTSQRHDRRAPLLALALAACNPASGPADAAAWRAVVDLDVCRHLVARDPAASAPGLSWGPCPDDPTPGCERLTLARTANNNLQGPPRVAAHPTLFGPVLELAGPSAAGDELYLYAPDARPYLGLRTVRQVEDCRAFSMASGSRGDVVALAMVDAAGQRSAAILKGPPRPDEAWAVPFASAPPGHAFTRPVISEYDTNRAAVLRSEAPQVFVLDRGSWQPIYSTDANIRDGVFDLVLIVLLERSDAGDVLRRIFYTEPQYPTVLHQSPPDREIGHLTSDGMWLFWLDVARAAPRHVELRAKTHLEDASLFSHHTVARFTAPFDVSDLSAADRLAPPPSTPPGLHLTSGSDHAAVLVRRPGPDLLLLAGVDTGGAWRWSVARDARAPERDGPAATTTSAAISVEPNDLRAVVHVDPSALWLDHSPGDTLDVRRYPLSAFTTPAAFAPL
jgi:hypothetical protein